MTNRLFMPLFCVLFSASVFAIDSDFDGVPDQLDPEPGNVLETGYQPPWYKTFYGDSVGDKFGVSVSSAGDVNNDGYADVIVGAYLDDDNGNSSGSARVFSGMDGSIIFTFYGDSAIDHFGNSVSGAGDVNNDGYDDMIVGAPDDDNNGDNTGSARVFSGVDGNILYTFDGDNAGQYFGYSVSDAGDVNADGYADVIVGAWYGRETDTITGQARIFSGFNGSILYTFYGSDAFENFGISVSSAGDINKDGYADVIVGANRVDGNGVDAGSAYVFSGINGSVLYTFSGENDYDNLGYSVSGSGDVNGDGYPDIVVGIMGDDTNGSGSGSAKVFSGVDGGIIYSFYGDSPSDGFGRTVSGAGDVNGDGFKDVVVGAWLDDDNGSDAGSARIFSGAMFLQQTIDTDEDGQINTLDNDDDNDGVPDVSDAFPLVSSESLDTDQDGIGNNTDWDDDNDGVPDIVDAEPLNNANTNEIALPLDSTYKGNAVRQDSISQ